MEVEIFDCVNNDDVNGLQFLMDYPNIFQIEDDDGFTILQRAIVNKRNAVFDFLLSLDGCPINARNSEGETALQVALLDPQPRNDNEHFTYSLLTKGGNMDCIGSAEILCIALRCEWFDVAKFLFEKGVDLNCDCDGECIATALRRLTYSGNNGENVENLLAMMLYFGADPLIPGYNGFKPIDCFFSYGNLTREGVEHLLFYVFDNHFNDYKIPITSLLNLMQSDPPFARQVLERLTSSSLSDNEVRTECFFLHLFEIRVEYLQLLLDQFDCVIQSVIEDCLECYHESCLADESFNFFRHEFVANFYVLLQSQFCSDLIQLINRTRIIKCMIESYGIPRNELFALILFALSYGAILYDTDLEVIYEIWGDCEFFRILLHMDIRLDNGNRNRRGIMPALLYDIHLDIETFLNHPDKYECSPYALRQLLKYFAHPKLQDFCLMEFENIHAQLELPRVPLLVELARNQVRKFLIEKYKIENSTQFYILIKRLPISPAHGKIITLETELY